MANRQEIPGFFIYGEHQREVEASFVHVERVSDRAHLHNGHVVPPLHPHLHQLSCWIDAEGSLRYDERQFELGGLVVAWIPSGVVHGFTAGAKSDCIVASLYDDFVVHALGGSGIARIERALREPMILRVPGNVRDLVQAGFERLETECRYPSWAQRHIVSAQLRILFLEILRLADRTAQLENSANAVPPLFERFLALLEKSFKRERSVGYYVASLSATPYLLNQATLLGAGQKPSAMIRARTVQEAKRMLLYSDLEVEQVAFTLGFDDPAHFGRFFRSVTAVSPGKWRRLADRGAITR